MVKRFHFIEEFKNSEWVTCWPSFKDDFVTEITVAYEEFKSKIETLSKKTYIVTKNHFAVSPTFDDPRFYTVGSMSHRELIKKNPIRLIAYAVGEDGCFIDKGEIVYKIFTP